MGRCCEVSYKRWLKYLDSQHLLQSFVLSRIRGQDIDFRRCKPRFALVLDCQFRSISWMQIALGLSFAHFGPAGGGSLSSMIARKVCNACRNQVSRNMVLRRLLGTGLLRLVYAASAALTTAAVGCSSETLFQSSFNSNTVGAPPAHAQAVGTIRIAGPPGSVVIVGPVPNSSENWVRISRTAGPAVPVTTMECDFSQSGGDGSYGFLAVLFIPTGSGLATVEFDTTPHGSPAAAGFLHLDFLQNNTVRINDDPKLTFGKFPRDQFFTLSVSLDIAASSAVAHMTLLGSGTSGSMDYAIPLLNLARQYGAIKLWMGFPWSGSFDATDIIVTRRR
jgi:hypothetical protein